MKSPSKEREGGGEGGKERGGGKKDFFFPPYSFVVWGLAPAFTRMGMLWKTLNHTVR